MTVYAVESEIAGTVWEVSAKVGDQLTPDDPIVVIESMKMEIPVIAEDGGVLVELLVAKGDVIAEGQVIARVETK